MNRFIECGLSKKKNDDDDHIIKKKQQQLFHFGNWSIGREVYTYLYGMIWNSNHLLRLHEFDYT